MPRSVQYVYRSQKLRKINKCMWCQHSIPNENTKNNPPSVTFSKIPRTWTFHVVIFQRTAKKCTKNNKALAQLLFYLLNLFVWWRFRSRCRHGLLKVPLVSLSTDPLSVYYCVLSTPRPSGNSQIDRSVNGCRFKGVIKIKSTMGQTLTRKKRKRAIQSTLFYYL